MFCFCHICRYDDFFELDSCVSNLFLRKALLHHLESDVVFSSRVQRDSNKFDAIETRRVIGFYLPNMEHRASFPVVLVLALDAQVQLSIAYGDAYDEAKFDGMLLS